MKKYFQTFLAFLRRMPGQYLIALSLLVAVIVLSPQQATVVLYKFSLVSLAAIFAFFVDRTLFSHLVFGVDDSLPQTAVGGARIVARALIVFAVVLGVTLGV